MASSKSLKADIHSAAEAMRHASLSGDPQLAPSGARRGVSALRSEQREANAEAPRRATEGLFKAICSTDLLFLIDTTSSMGSYIDAAKDQVRNIVRDITAAFLDDAEVRISVVGYKDHGDSPNVQVLDFTTSPSQVYSFLDTLRATGGGDAPEDVLGGIRQALHAKWRHRTRCVIHIADAPPHGRVLHDLPDSHDSYANPGSEPHGLTYGPLIKQMADLHINYALLRINDTTDRMAFVFLQTYAAASADCSLLQTNKYYSAACSIAPKANGATGGLLFWEAKLGISFVALRHLVVRAVTASASRTASRHVPRARKAAADTSDTLESILEPTEEDEDYLPDEPLETAQPRWDTPGWLNETLDMVGFTSDAVVHSANTLNDMMESDDNIAVSELEVTVRRRQHPFAQGSQRTASYAGTAASDNRYVAKAFKRPGSRLPRLAEDMQCQALCKSFALEFNAVLGGEHLIDFIATACFKGEPGGVSDDGCVSLEPFLEGEYTKYNSNSGWVNDDMGNKTNQAAQAFSHFTFERSKGRFLVSDLQGVGEMLTDPAVHTLDPDRFNLSSSNLGEEGFKFFFASHECNDVCRRLQLKTSQAMVRSRSYQFRESWPSLADSVCCSNMLCGRILLRADANESPEYGQCRWCDACWPQLKQYTERRPCAAQSRRRHEFEISRFFYESQGQSIPDSCPQHREEDITGSTASGEGESSTVPLAVVAEGELWDNMRPASVSLEYS